MNRLLFLSLTLSLFGQHSAISGETLYIFIGSSAQENADVQGAMNAMLVDRPAGTKMLLDVIARTPNHELANVLLAKQLLRQGDAPGALLLIERFLEGNPPSLQCLGLSIEIADALGDDKRRIRSAKLMQSISDETKGAFKNWSNASLIAEIMGRKNEALSFLVPSIAESPNVRITKYWQLGRLHMRGGNHDLAEKAFAAARQEAEQAMPTWRGLLQLDHAKSLWALNRISEAQRASIDATQYLLAADDGHSRDELADALCLTILLTRREGHATKKASKEVEELMLRATRFLDEGNGSLISRTAAALVFGDVNKVTDEVVASLKRAPHWNEGLWCALYLGLVSPESTERLHDFLPTSSVQRSVLLSIHKSRR